MNAADSQSKEFSRAQNHLARQDRVSFSVAPWTILLSAGVVGVGALVALAVVASVRDSDALATIALALAIVSFAVQILVFIVQGRTSTDQMLRTEQLNRETSGLLAEVSTSAKSTQDLIGNQFNNLLSVFLRSVEVTAEETKSDPQLFNKLLLENLRESSQANPDPNPTASPPQQSDDGEKEQRLAERRKKVAEQVRERREALRKPLKEMEAWPDEALGKKLIADLENLGEDAQERLKAYALDEVRSRQNGSWIGLAGDADPIDQELRNAGYIAPFRERIDDEIKNVHRLTDTGRQLARLYTAVGEVPAYAADKVTAAAAVEDDIPF